MDNEQALTNDAATPTASFKQFDDLTSTVEFDHPPATTDESSSQDAKPAEVAKDEEEKGGRLDRDGRFKEVLNSNKELKSQLAQLTKQMEEMRSGVKSNEDVAESKETKGFFKMTADEILDLQATDPIKYARLLRESLLQDINAEHRERKIKTTYEKYSEQNPDFEEMWDSGEIQKFLDANPGHNTISAHQMLTMEKRIAQAKEAAIKEATEKLRADLRVKGKAAIVGQGPSGVINMSENSNQDLKEPKKFGGMYAVLARRSQARNSTE